MDASAVALPKIMSRSSPLTILSLLPAQADRLPKFLRKEDGSAANPQGHDDWFDDVDYISG